MQPRGSGFNTLGSPTPEVSPRPSSSFLLQRFSKLSLFSSTSSRLCPLPPPDPVVTYFVVTLGLRPYWGYSKTAQVFEVSFNIIARYSFRICSFTESIPLQDLQYPAAPKSTTSAHGHYESRVHRIGSVQACTSHGVLSNVSSSSRRTCRDGVSRSLWATSDQWCTVRLDSFFRHHVVVVERPLLLTAPPKSSNRYEPKSKNRDRHCSSDTKVATARSSSVAGAKTFAFAFSGVFTILGLCLRLLLHLFAHIIDICQPPRSVFIGFFCGRGATIDFRVGNEIGSGIWCGGSHATGPLSN